PAPCNPISIVSLACIVQRSDCPPASQVLATCPVTCPTQGRCRSKSNAGAADEDDSGHEHALLRNGGRSMKLILRFVIALVLTGPVFIGLSRIDPLARWVGSEAAWSAL